jgi:hypothetical protein
LSLEFALLELAPMDFASMAWIAPAAIPRQRIE